MFSFICHVSGVTSLLQVDFQDREKTERIRELILSHQDLNHYLFRAQQIHQKSILKSQFRRFEPGPLTNSPAFLKCSIS